MTKLNVSSNALCAEGGKFLAAALKGNHVMKELDISSNYLAEDANDKPDMSGVIAFANAISDMGALSVLSLKSNCLCNKEAGKGLAEMLAANTVLKELDLSDNTGRGARDGAGFAQELAVGIRDNGAMTSLNLASNRLYAGGAKIVAEAIKVKNCARTCNHVGTIFMSI